MKASAFNFRAALIISVLLHFVVIMSSYLGVRSKNKIYVKALNLEKISMNVEVVEGFPMFTMAQKHDAMRQLEAKKEAALILEKKKTANIRAAKSNALERLKSISKLKSSSKKGKDLALKKLMALKSMKKRYGVKAKEGNSSWGSDAEQDQVEKAFKEYVLSVVSKIRANWSLPQWLKALKLRSSIVLSINEEGKIVKLEIMDKSGSTVFDDYSIKSVKLSAPFAKPDSAYLAKIKDEGIVLGFPE